MIFFKRDKAEIKYRYSAIKQSLYKSKLQFAANFTSVNRQICETAYTKN